MLTAVGLALVVALTVVAAAAVSSRSWDVARTRAESAADRAAVVIGAEVADAVRAVEDASGTAEPEKAPRPASLRSLALLPAGDTIRGGEGPTELTQDPAVRVALAQARDSGLTILSAPTEGARSRSVIVRALYRSVDGPGDRTTALTTADRRARHDASLVAVLDAEDLIAATDVEGARLTDGDALLAGPVRPANGEIRAAVPVVDRRWQVAAAVSSPSTALVWVIVGIGAVLGLVVLGAWRSWRTVVIRGRSAADRAADRTDAVLAYSGVTQESLDLGQVVPALAVELSDRLGLRGISLSIVGREGQRRVIFAHGEVPEPRADFDGIPSTASPGDSVAIPLRRAERSIGELRVRCGKSMGRDDFDQLRIVGELITSTVVASRSIEQQQEALSRLRSLDELKTSFLGTASHELRTPVTAISGFAHMLSDRWESLTDENRRVFADRIAANAKVLEALVQDLLDFARLERGEVNLVLETVDLAAVADRVLDRLEPVWSSHTVERSINPGSFVTGDVSALERIVTNLVSNAVKFSPDGSKVTVSVDGDDQVRLTVDDEGPGVPSGERDRIFVRFFRGAGDAIVRTSGVGIGLSVVQDYVAEMGGRIHVDGNPAGGARFVVELAPAIDPDPLEEERSDATT